MMGGGREFPGIHVHQGVAQAEAFRVPQAGRLVAPNLAIECNPFRIPLAGGIDGTNPWCNPLCYDRRVDDLMDVVTLECDTHQTDVHFRQVIITKDDSHDGDDDLFECFVLFVVHNTAVSSSAA